MLRFCGSLLLLYITSQSWTTTTGKWIIAITQAFMIHRISSKMIPDNADWGFDLHSTFYTKHMELSKSWIRKTFIISHFHSKLHLSFLYHPFPFLLLNEAFNYSSVNALTFLHWSFVYNCSLVNIYLGTKQSLFRLFRSGLRIVCFISVDTHEEAVGEGPTPASCVSTLPFLACLPSCVSPVFGCLLP